MMKPKQTNLKLKLNKQSVSNLSKSEMQMIQTGEDAAITTSVGNCTGFTCCTASQTCTIWQVVLGTIVGTLTPKA